MLYVYENKINELKKHAHFRFIREIKRKEGKYIYINGEKLLNLSSNNYLNFADNKELTEKFYAQGGDKYSPGSASTLLFNSGYHANVGINSSLAGKGDVIFSDKLNHASIIDGMRLSEAKFFRYPHNNMEALEKLLVRERNNFKNAVIVSESVFSMDGDIADLAKLVELKNKYNCLLVLDEAHAFGVFGKTGLGVSEDLGLLKDVDLLIGTFGKAIGSMGAFATGKKILIDYLINSARSFIFSTALPPVNIAFSKWIIENELPQTYEKRKKMLELGKKFGSESHIIPVIIGSNEKTVEMCDILYKNGYFTLPIRPPTVPQGTSRIRLSLTSDIEEKDLEKLCSILGSTNKTTKN